MPKPLASKTPKRGRPVKSLAQRQEMKTQISEIAKTLFQQEGYAKVSMRRIAKEMGCTPMTLYGYYDGKIDILRTLWGGVFKELFDHLGAIRFEKNPKAYLQTLCVTYVNYWINNPDYYRLVFMAEGVTQPDVSVFLDNPDIVIQYTLFLDAIQNLESEKQIADSKIQLDFLISAMHGIAHNKVTLSSYDWSSPEDQIQYIIKGISAS